MCSRVVQVVSGQFRVNLQTGFRIPAREQDLYDDKALELITKHDSLLF